MKKNIGAKQTITTMIITDPYNLQRFLGAQESFYAQALKEIPESIITEMRNRLPSQFWTVMEQLEKKISK